LAAVRTPALVESSGFKEAKRALAGEYREIDRVVSDLEDLIRCDYLLPAIQVDAKEMPNVYAIRMDYPPLGERGIGLFLVTYHATPRTPVHPVRPYRTFTMLTIEERQRR